MSFHESDEEYIGISPPQNLGEPPAPVSNEEYFRRLSEFMGEDRATEMITTWTQSREEEKEKKHNCCVGRGCGDCSYCLGDCNQCNNLDCEGEECGNCYTCYKTNPNNFTDL